MPHQHQLWSPSVGHRARCLVHVRCWPSRSMRAWTLSPLSLRCALATSLWLTSRSSLLPVNGRLVSRRSWRVYQGRGTARWSATCRPASASSGCGVAPQSRPPLHGLTQPCGTQHPSSWVSSQVTASCLALASVLAWAATGRSLHASSGRGAPQKLALWSCSGTRYATATQVANGGSAPSATCHRVHRHRLPSAKSANYCPVTSTSSRCGFAMRWAAGPSGPLSRHPAGWNCQHRPQGRVSSKPASESLW
mmetsp:Transcript_76607/g.197296  ORF Transcript_76607/g.197296 Transcript_76607/m.197296 type:complete len:250 (-) Transcript_76607:217-966(-)